MFNKLIESGALSFSQHNQDLFVLDHTGMKTGGFFVEFGAMDGVELSNTLLLEKYYGWNGIVAEPLPELFNKISKNRSCSADPRCVSSKTGQRVPFIKAEFEALSTMKEYISHDHWADTRSNNSIEIEVETVTLDDLLDFHNAPEEIDYLSIDTEGSELLILEAFSFDRKINIITAEHNHASHKIPMRKFLESKGYKLIHSEYSGWEDWFVLNK